MLNRENRGLSLSLEVLFSRSDSLDACDGKAPTRKKTKKTVRGAWFKEDLIRHSTENEKTTPHMTSAYIKGHKGQKGRASARYRIVHYYFEPRPKGKCMVGHINIIKSVVGQPPTPIAFELPPDSDNNEELRLVQVWSNNIIKIL